MKDLLQQLLQVWGPSGYEHHVRALIADTVREFVDELRVDPLGNLICRVGSGGKRVMVAAHMDEIGVMASYQEPNSGFLHFESVGGLIQSSLFGSRVQFEDGTIGVIGVHDQWGDGRTKTPDVSNFFIDISDGGENRFAVGQPGRFYAPMGFRGELAYGRAMDDRVGCLVAIEALRKLNKQVANEVYVVFTVQEEVGVRGAKAATAGVMPEIGIALDVTATGDTPRGLKMTVELGKGTAIKVKDLGLIVPPQVIAWMEQTAQANSIPYQLEVLPMGQTDAAAIHTSLAGIPSGCISIPCRYVHTDVETVDLRDVQASINLLVALLANPITL
ncbi:MAG: M42 family metallopeptidase [Phototrophicaceae bacterium]|jgi:endoglucanase